MGCGKHYSNARFISQGEVAIGRSLLQGRCQERVAIGGSWHQGEVAIGRSLLQGRCQERVAIGGSWHLWRKSRSGDRSYRGGVRRESPLGEVGIYGEVAIGRSLLQGRCQERGRHRGKLAFMEKVAIGRSLLQKT